MSPTSGPLGPTDGHTIRGATGAPTDVADRHRWCGGCGAGRGPAPRADARRSLPLRGAAHRAIHARPRSRWDRGAAGRAPLAYANPWIEVFHDEVDRPDGSEGIYGVVHFRSAAVGVVAVADDGRLLLVGQHRYSLDEYSWEIPEGGVGEGESLVDGARRELREETGFDGDATGGSCAGSRCPTP